jgi:transposase
MDRIDIESERSLDEWCRKFKVTHDQLREAVRAVGSRAADVELHLTGSRSTTNQERVDEAGASSGREEK